MKKEQHHKKLVQRYLSGKASEEELVVFFRLLSEGKLDKFITEQMEEDLPETPNNPAIHRGFSFWLKLAAALVIGASFVTWMFISEQADNTLDNAPEIVIVKPGSEKASLTLPDGTVIDLDEQQKRIDVDAAVTLKNENGSLKYDFVDLQATGRAALANQFSNIQTPAGGTYRVVLPDHSVVWLNSRSRLTFPVIFGDTERKVFAEGEVYFEVAKDVSRPFIVEMNGNIVKVLGTEFNINGYSDEPDIRTTVLGGSVEVLTGTAGVRIGSGQQAIVTSGNENILVKPVDVEHVIAWKDGFFRFEQVDLQTLIRQIARWYNLEVSYEGKINSDSFVGKISRSEDIESVLKILRQAKLNIELKGRRLIIRQN